ncbi:MAG: wax ester/triacylglycerol synthase family O-acyltransferase [Acidobacteria bacterium]|nr:wax ester/triacylglycerol synthase family O-acyltransferase [Acidobacteriota bacterium]
MHEEPLSSVDAAWLHMEHPANLMMVTGVLTFDEPLDFASLTRVIGDGLKPYPRFRQRVVEPRLPLGSPRWELDPAFDLHSHVHRVALPSPGDQQALQELVSDLMSTPLDFSKPLWQFHLIEGYGSGCAVLARLHHAIADGIALIQVLLSLTDQAPPVPEAPPVPPEPTGWERLGSMTETLLKPTVDALKRSFVEPSESSRPGDASGALPGLPVSARALLAPAAAVVSRAVQATETLWHEGVSWLSHPENALELVERAAGGANALGKLLLMSPDPMTAFKGPLGVAKRAAWSGPIPLADVKRVGRALSATINDVLLACATGALRRYLAGGEPLHDLEVRAVVPVNLRSPTDTVRLGNRFGLVFLPLPVGLEDPLDRLYELKQRMDDIKRSPEAVVAFGLLGAIGMAPTEIEHLVLNLFGTRGTAVMTNVPGPREPISLAGKRVSGLMFWVPQSGRLGLGLSILSYAGNVSIGVATDAGLVPDPEKLVADFALEFDELLTIVKSEEEATPVPAAAVVNAAPPSPPKRRKPTRKRKASR